MRGAELCNDVLRDQVLLKNPWFARHTKSRNWPQAKAKIDSFPRCPLGKSGQE
jgi:hypothetical protein